MAGRTPQPIHTALIGLGYAGTVFHAPLILSLPHLFTIHYIVEKLPPDELLQGNTIADKFGDQARLIADFANVLVDPDVELVSGVLCRSYSCPRTGHQSYQISAVNQP